MALRCHRWHAPRPTTLASVLLVIVAVGCGDNHSRASSSAKPYPPGGYVHEDGDNDTDETLATANTGDDRDFASSYGRGASPADTRAISQLLKRYFTAAVAGDARTACSLLDATLVQQLEQIERQAGAGNCMRVVSTALTQQHPALAADDPSTMTVIFVHVKGNLGLAALGFTTAPEQEIVLARQSGRWKVDGLSGSDLT